ncbi:hypothetical protein CIB84_010497, partial [Bambusicola thoracicus]
MAAASSSASAVPVAVPPSVAMAASCAVWLEDQVTAPPVYPRGARVGGRPGGRDKELQFHIVQQARAQSAKEGIGYTEGCYSSLPVEVPQNHKRFTCDLTQADRLALYDYVVEETKKQRSRSHITENDSDLFVDLAAKITQDDSQKGPKSHLEILAEMRDYKRRRQSYRAKNVHITKKSYTEVIRDVIGVHMEELSNHWQEE